ncbi:histidine kinase [Polaribacter sp. IC066]|uniref:sensor histidine kinase n=2 Tax=unclassified Polaribacter TaxID=196858 RepID=UPI0011BD4C6F|nr:histidine kinase [Polaribacter sp. IC066]TXD51634.1 histidine kinase [Polaribacter sp. IC063]TXD58794.1 histidine kinase [Polaribacter sp. IC066]
MANKLKKQFICKMNKAVLKTLKKLPLHLVFWGIVWFFFSSFFSVGSNNENFIFWFSTILSVIAIAASYVFAYYLIPNFLIAKKHKQFVLYTFYASVFIVCAVLMTVVFGFVFFYNLEFQQMPALTKNSGVILVCVLLIIALTSAFKILKDNYKSLDEKKTLENKFLQTQLQLKEQELKFLKMQIHPHFLFNTLNTLYGFTLKKSEKAPEMILKLSSLLDYILYQVDKPFVLLQDEINHIEDYVSLEKFRFQEGLQVTFHTYLMDEKFEVPPMLLLPFVENAFKHGTQIDGVINVNINLKVDEKELNFTIENFSKNKETSKKGIGLATIKKRLEMLYQKKYLLEILQEEALFRVNLKIPIKK